MLSYALTTNIQTNLIPSPTTLMEHLILTYASYPGSVAQTKFASAVAKWRDDMKVATGSLDDDKEEQQELRNQASDLTNSPAYIVFGERGAGKSSMLSSLLARDFLNRQQAVEEVAKADPDNIQEVAASQLSIINSYYQSGLQQSQQSFRWSLIWGGIGLAFLTAAVSFLLIRQPTEIAIASGIGGALVQVFAGTYLFLYKHASDQLAAFRTSLESTQRLLLANSMCEKLEGEIEQKTRAELILLMVQSATSILTREKQKAS